jgi:hypothetical protein
MIFSASDFTMDKKSTDGNKGHSFAPLPPKPNGRNKSMCVHDRIPPNPANSRHSCTVTFAGGAFRNSPLRPDPEGPASGRSSSSHKVSHLYSTGRPTSTRVGHHHHARARSPRGPREAGNQLHRVLGAAALAYLHRRAAGADVRTTTKPRAAASTSPIAARAADGSHRDHPPPCPGLPPSTAASKVEDERVPPTAFGAGGPPPPWPMPAAAVDVANSSGGRAEPPLFPAVLGTCSPWAAPRDDTGSSGRGREGRRDAGGCGDSRRRRRRLWGGTLVMACDVGWLGGKRNFDLHQKNSSY